jgi:putative PIN family toxin of toxin-antitoxin system
MPTFTAPTMRIVLDTNVLVSLLVFGDVRLAPLHAAWAAGRLVVVSDAAVAAEFRRVLDYPQFARRCDAAQTFERYRARVDIVAAPGCDMALPRCRDPHDQKFVELAAVSGAQALLTEDKALLRLRRKLRFVVEPPALFQRRLA